MHVACNMSERYGLLIIIQQHVRQKEVINVPANYTAFHCKHPLNRTDKLSSLTRFARWQIGSRLLPGAVSMPFVNESRLLVSPGMTGATGNVYCGLHELEDMAFVLHCLRDTDVFVDIGANIGSYTVLASGAVGARTISVEPIPSAYTYLIDNIRINNIQSKVSPLNIGLGSSKGTLRFSSDRDTMNHVLVENEEVESIVEVAVDTIDNIVADSPPSLIKIDVEGFETEVIAGADQTLSNPTLLALIMELNGSGHRYGYDEEALHNQIVSYGFTPSRYQPLKRLFSTVKEKGTSGNTLYVRDFEAANERLQTAPKYKVGKSYV
jgi:FkbM family methyltransferase